MADDDDLYDAYFGDGADATAATSTAAGGASVDVAAQDAGVPEYLWEAMGLTPRASAAAGATAATAPPGPAGAIAPAALPAYLSHPTEAATAAPPSHVSVAAPPAPAGGTAATSSLPSSPPVPTTAPTDKAAHDVAVAAKFPRGSPEHLRNWHLLVATKAHEARIRAQEAYRAANAPLSATVEARLAHQLSLAWCDATEMAEADMQSEKDQARKMLETTLRTRTTNVIRDRAGSVSKETTLWGELFASIHEGEPTQNAKELDLRIATMCIAACDRASAAEAASGGSASADTTPDKPRGTAGAGSSPEEQGRPKSNSNAEDVRPVAPGGMPLHAPPATYQHLQFDEAELRPLLDAALRMRAVQVGDVDVFVVHTFGTSLSVFAAAFHELYTAEKRATWLPAQATKAAAAAWRLRSSSTRPRASSDYVRMEASGEAPPTVVSLARSQSSSDGGRAASLAAAASGVAQPTAAPLGTLAEGAATTASAGSGAPTAAVPTAASRDDALLAIEFLYNDANDFMARLMGAFIFRFPPLGGLPGRKLLRSVIGHATFTHLYDGIFALFKEAYAADDTTVDAALEKHSMALAEDLGVAPKFRLDGKYIDQLRAKEAARLARGGPDSPASPDASAAGGWGSDIAQQVARFKAKAADAAASGASSGSRGGRDGAAGSGSGAVADADTDTEAPLLVTGAADKFAHWRPPPGGVEPYQRAIDEFRTLPYHRSPAAKLDVLERTLAAAQECVYDYYAAALSRAEVGMLGGDELIPLFTLIVLRSGVRALTAEYEFIRKFLSPAERLGKGGYLAVALESALGFVVEYKPPAWKDVPQVDWLSGAT